MKIPLYQIDTFTGELFKGNPAAVCTLESWLPDEVMQQIAAENNLSETAFLVKKNDHYQLKWFTPLSEVDLCGHATLGAAFVIFNFIDPGPNSIDFETRSGVLRVVKKGEALSMIFPKREASVAPVPKGLAQALGEATPEEVLLSRDLLLIYKDEASVRALKPDMETLKTFPGMGVIASAPGTKSDFVCRYFAPKVGIPEDPVTGSAQSTLIPYWVQRLGRRKMYSIQVSERGGHIQCEDAGDSVEISGEAVLFMKGEIDLPG